MYQNITCHFINLNAFHTSTKIILNGQNQYYQNVHITKGNIYIQRHSNQMTNNIPHRAEKKRYTERVSGPVSCWLQCKSKVPYLKRENQKEEKEGWGGKKEDIQGGSGPAMRHCRPSACSAYIPYRDWLESATPLLIQLPTNVSQKTAKEALGLCAPLPSCGVSRLHTQGKRERERTIVSLIIKTSIHRFIRAQSL